MPLPAELFAVWFLRATGHTPFSYQATFATGDELPNLLDVPTGLGKTACAVLTHDAAPCRTCHVAERPGRGWPVEHVRCQI